MRFRAVTLNMEQDHKRWEERRGLLAEELCALKPDVLALNEVCVPLQTARWLQGVLKARTGTDYALVQQTKVNALAPVEAEAMLTRFPLIETGNLDYRAQTWWPWSVADGDGQVSHPYWSRMDRCIDYIWVSGAVKVVESGVCFNGRARAIRRSGHRIMQAYGPT
jgi:hypothetical protein